MKRLEEADLPLMEAPAILNDAKLRMQNFPGNKGQLFEQKIKDVLRRNPGIEILESVSKVPAGNEVVAAERDLPW